MKKPKTQVISQKSLSKPSQAVKYSYHNYTNLTNQQYLYHSLKLLGMNECEYLKQTKLALNDEMFGKTQSATNTKQFFYCVYTCMKTLCNQGEFSQIKIWYPPRNVNQQIQFKKVLFNLFIKLQNRNIIPKKLLISKTFLMGDTPTSKVIQFLRILSQLALRCSYIQRYSKQDRLIQIPISQSIPALQSNSINRFYCYPFSPSQSSVNPPLALQQIQHVKQIYQLHIEMYRKKILGLATKYQKQQIITCQQQMMQLNQEKQIQYKLKQKIPKEVLSQNRAFDRRKLIDKSRHVWSILNTIQCHFIQTKNTPLLKLQGEVDQILSKWQTPSGINKIHDINKITQKLSILKQNCAQKLQEFRQIRQNLNKVLKPYSTK